MRTFKTLLSIQFLLAGTTLFATNWDVVKTPLKWTNQGIDFILRDQLRVREMSWPRTLLEYAVDFSASPVAESNLWLIDAVTNQHLPFQFTDIRKESGKIISATLCFFSDLPSGGEKKFRLFESSSSPVKTTNSSLSVASADGTMTISNGRIRIVLPFPGTHKKMVPPIIRMGDKNDWLGISEMPSIEGFIKMDVKEVSVGAVFAEYLIHYQFQKGKQFQVKIRIADDSDFFVFEENMSGFTEKDSLAWKIKWNNFRPEYRYCNNRPEKPIDYSGVGYSQFPWFKTFPWEPIQGNGEKAGAIYHPDFALEQNNGPDGLLPFNLTPYHNEGFWWRLHTSAFWDNRTGKTVGLFIKDFENWIDPEYPIYGNRPNLSVSYYYLDSRFWWSLPLVTGKRSLAVAIYPHQKDMDLVNETNLPYLYVDELRRWNGWISLNKVKNWILDYEPCKPVTPDCFEPYAEHVGYSALHGLLEDKIWRVLYKPERSRSGRFPVDVRNLYNDFVQEMAEADLTAEEYRQVRAMMLFMTYVYMDEALMPMKTMLAGHPDFFSDVKGVSGLAAFLFPDHPYAKEMADNFEKSIALNLRYHVRPAIPLWDAKGGRWTENLGHYVWASLRNMTKTSFLLHNFYDGKNRILQPGISLLGNWLVNAVAAPLDIEGGKRVIPPQGAHHNFDVPPSYFYLLGQELRYFDPLLAEHIFWESSPDAKAFAYYDDKGLEQLARSNLVKTGGTNPNLKSEKFTGYGLTLRTNFGKPDEMYVFLQQIDEGQNARWGIAAKGGNGIIYYYANGKRYSHNEGSEDVGDVSYGDTERCTNFGVKKNEKCYRCIGDYRSVGRNDLTDPLYDFGFAQSASINANSEAAPEYKSRSVILSGNDYIVVFDDLRDQTLEGRFSWFVGSRDSFPYIHQLMPGAKPQNINKTGRYYDGKGDFLTLVTHKKEVQSSLRGSICEVKRNSSFDLVFRGDKNISYSQSGSVFEGTSGIIRHDDATGEYEAALFIGDKIGIPGVSVSWTKKPAFGGFSIKSNSIGFQGFIQVTEPASLQFSLGGNPEKGFAFYLDGIPVSAKVSQNNSFTIQVKSGKFSWQWTNIGVIPSAPMIKNAFSGATWSHIEWNPVAGADSYKIQMSTDSEKTWLDVAMDIKVTYYQLSGLTDGKKVHVRIIARGKGGLSEPSNDYPIYPTSAVPHCPEGLWVVKEGNKVSVSWGQILGANNYTLYQRTKGTSDYQTVYSGPERNIAFVLPDSLKVYEFCITATNGNGESGKSVVSDTDENRIINWYPVPGETYRRVTESYEQGYSEWNNLLERNLPVLKYLTEEKSNKL